MLKQRELNGNWSVAKSVLNWPLVDLRLQHFAVQVAGLLRPFAFVLSSPLVSRWPPKREWHKIYIFARWMFLVIPFLFASHIVVVAGNVVQSRPVTRFERPRALRLVDISLCGHVVVVVAFCCFCCSSVDHFQLCPRWIFKPIGIVVRDVRGIC